MTDFQAISKASKAKNEKNDCAVRAVTVVSNMPYSSVHEVFRLCGRKPKRSTAKFITNEVLQALQIWREDVTKQFPAKTIRTLGRMLPKKGRFLIHTSGHILAARNGEIWDWTKGRLHRILKIEQVTF